MAAFLIIDMLVNSVIVYIFYRTYKKMDETRSLVKFQAQQIEDLIKDFEAGQSELNDALSNLESDLRNELADAGDVRSLEHSVDSLQDQINDIELDREGR